MSTDKQGKTLEEMILMSDEDFLKVTNPEDNEDQESDDVSESEDTNNKDDKSPEKDTEDKSSEVTDEEDLSKLSKEDIIKKLQEEREGKKKAEKRIEDQKVFIERRNKEVGELRSSVKDAQSKIRDLHAEYESKYLSDPAEARKISKEIDKAEEALKVNTDKIHTIEASAKNLEQVLEVHPDVDKYIPDVVKMWKEDPQNKSPEDQKLISDFESNYQSMIMNPLFMIKEINKVKINASKKQDPPKKKETPVQKITKASEHSTYINGSASDSSEKAGYSLAELVDLPEDQFQAVRAKERH